MRIFLLLFFLFCCFGFPLTLAVAVSLGWPYTVSREQLQAEDEGYVWVGVWRAG